MTKFWLRRFSRFLREESGPTAVEYAVMLALILMVCVAAIASIGSNVNSSFSNSTLKSALSE
ncbi:MAG: Flp family type IVb pilin [Bacteroidales bacterium]|nr:Flp family type IVb pilin [Bacteroidales bacterium]